MVKKLFLVFIIVSTLFLGLAIVYVSSPRFFYGSVSEMAMGTISLLNLNKQYNTKYGVHPLLDKKVETLLKEAKKHGINLKVTCGFRSPELQNKLYNQGRTTKGNIVTYAPAGFSYHNYGFAVDVWEYKNGKPVNNAGHWKLIGKLGKEQGLVWGGDWKKLVDRPHFQLSNKDILYGVILGFQNP